VVWGGYEERYLQNIYILSEKIYNYAKEVIKVMDSNKIKINTYIMSDLLQSQLINYLTSRKLLLAIEPNSIQIKFSKNNIEYIIVLQSAEFNLIKKEIDYILSYILDNMPILKSAFIKQGKNNSSIIFCQER
jgi:hypothetical protein